MSDRVNLLELIYGVRHANELPEINRETFAKKLIFDAGPDCTLSKHQLIHLMDGRVDDWYQVNCMFDELTAFYLAGRNTKEDFPKEDYLAVIFSLLVIALGVKQDVDDGSDFHFNKTLDAFRWIDCAASCELKQEHLYEILKILVVARKE